MKLCYDGTKYMGWQIQRHPNTVQARLQKALYDFSGTKTNVVGSGRTDTGVHALAQYAHFDYNGTANPEQMRKGLRKYLPDDIQIIKIQSVSNEFHARYDACERHYRYIISKNHNPFNRFYQGNFHKLTLNQDILFKIAPYFLGKHDFSTFCRLNPSVQDRVCNVVYSEFQETDDSYLYDIKANRFLHNMVRRIVGAMVSISHHKLDPEIVSYWLNQKQPKQTLIFPAPPQGLYLVDVRYPCEKIDFLK